MINKIINAIQSSKTGSISYSDFITLALYDPELGYYMKDQKKIGKEGDFYTNSNIHSVFGKVLCRVFNKLVKSGKFPPIICEIGAGTGRLADFILNEWKVIDSETFAKLNYYIVETSPYHRKQQQEYITHITKVQQFATMEEMTQKKGEFTGILLSNELFDAFPVDVVQQKDGTLFEVRVTVEEGELVETIVPCDKQEIFHWLDTNEIHLVNGQRIEIPLAMDDWLSQIEKWLNNGIMFTIDYGYLKEEWMEPIHREGSLRGFYKHQMITNPLLNPGDMDVTTHIHLDALIKKGEEMGLQLLAMLKQYQFLLRGGILEYLQDHYDSNPFSEISKQNRAIRSLLMDDGISASFTVVIQYKGEENITIEDVLLHEL